MLKEIKKVEVNVMDSSEGRTYNLTQINITGYDSSYSQVLFKTFK